MELQDLWLVLDIHRLEVLVDRVYVQEVLVLFCGLAAASQKVYCKRKVVGTYAGLSARGHTCLEHLSGWRAAIFLILRSRTSILRCLVFSDTFRLPFGILACSVENAACETLTYLLINCRGHVLL